MKLTAEERRSRIYQLAESDSEYLKMKAECDLARTQFADYADRQPDDLRNQLWSCPGMYYFLHHHLLNIICDQMKFPDED